MSEFEKPIDLDLDFKDGTVSFVKIRPIKIIENIPRFVDIDRDIHRDFVDSYEELISLPWIQNIINFGIFNRLSIQTDTYFPDEIYAYIWCEYEDDRPYVIAFIEKEFYNFEVLNLPVFDRSKHPEL